MANWLDSNLSASLVGVGGTLAGIIIGSWIASRQQVTERDERRRSLANSIAMELDDQSTSVLNICEYVRFLGDPKSVPSTEVFGLSRHLPGTPFVFRGQVQNLDLLNSEVSRYLVSYYSEAERACETTLRLVDAFGLAKSKYLSREEFELLSKKWKSVAYIGSLTTDRLLQYHSAAIPENIRSLLKTGADLLRKASNGEDNVWEHPDA